jgi:sigma-B regulation protein RsbU (phosphoserine phosphatase)
VHQLLELLSVPVPAGSTIRQFGAGDVIVREGEAGSEAYIVLSGNCEVTVHDEVLDHVLPGELFGEVACLGAGTRTATVRAVLDTTLLEMSVDTLRAELHRSPALLDTVLRALADRLRRISDREMRARDEHRSLRKVLERLQPSLDRFKSHTSLSVDVRSQPLTFSSGDYYDVLELTPARTLFALGDVMGHGAQTTPILAMMRGQLHESASAESTPEALLAHLHRHMQRHGHPNVFMTLTILILDLATSLAEVAVAGPPAPLLYRDGRCTPLTTQIGWTLGYPFDDVSYTSERIPMRSGDVVLFYTDGLSDVTPGEPAGESLGVQGLAAILRDAVAGNPASPAAAIFDGVAAIQNGRPFEDDATALVVSLR